MAKTKNTKKLWALRKDSGAVVFFYSVNRPARLSSPGYLWFIPTDRKSHIILGRLGANGMKPGEVRELK